MANKGNNKPQPTPAPAPARRNTTRQPPAPPVAAQMPPGVDPRGAEAMKNLQMLGQNPQAVEALRKVFAGAPGAAPGPVAPQSGPTQISGGGEEILFAAIANCVNVISKSAERTAIELILERTKVDELEHKLEAYRHAEEQSRVNKLAADETKRKFSAGLEAALKIATEQGGNTALADTMENLAQITGIELTPEHIWTLGNAKAEEPAKTAD